MIRCGAVRKVSFRPLSSVTTTGAGVAVAEDATALVVGVGGAGGATVAAGVLGDSVGALVWAGGAAVAGAAWGAVVGTGATAVGGGGVAGAAQASTRSAAITKRTAERRRTYNLLGFLIG